MIVIDLKELCPSPRPSPQRGEGEKTAPSSSLSRMGEEGKTAPSSSLSLKRRGGKDRRGQFPLPYGERVRVRGKGRPRQLPLPNEASGKNRRGQFPLPYGERVRVRGGKTAPSSSLSLKRRGGTDRREQFPLPCGERVRVRGMPAPAPVPATSMSSARCLPALAGRHTPPAISASCRRTAPGAPGSG